MSSLELDAKIYIAGHNGLVGSALWRYFVNQGYHNLIGWRSAEVDLRNREQTIEAITNSAPDVVILAAAKVGGIVANNTYPVEFLQDNVRIQTNVFEGSHIANVERLLFLGSSCIYPKFAEQPIKEDSLLTGPLEPTNDAYAIAKIAGVLNVQAYRREYNRNWISGMPTNLYGQGDNFDLQNSHVLPAMIRKFHEAKISGEGTVVLWGTGSPMREFLHVDDLAQACHYLLENYDDSAPVNIGWGDDVTIKELAEIVKETVGFIGEIVWDTQKPDGTPRKLLDTSTINNLGWKPKIQLRAGIKDTYSWYLANQTN
ncbi:MAG: GDP-L-fucose synthase [Actinobacteria bacterium]|nr:GDP-L-fucose synthase [Actinomycetota bacterium]